MSINEFVGSLDGYISKEISSRAKASRDVADLSLGEPWFGPPPMIAQIFDDSDHLQAIGSSLARYESASGNRHLREVIAERYLGRYGLPIDSDREVVVTGGGASAFVLVLHTLTELGDEVVIPDPSYMLYARTCEMLGRTPVRAPRSAADGWAIDAEAIRSVVTPRTRIVLVNSPENPTGYMVDDATAEALVALCAELDLTLVHDEVYDDFIYSGRHLPLRVTASGRCEVVLMNSFSKRYGLLGLRLGWLVASSSIAEAAARVHDYVALSVNGSAQYLGALLLGDGGVDKWVTERCRDLYQRRSAMLDAIGQVPGMVVHPGHPVGAFFMFVEVAGLADRLGLPQTDRPVGRVVADHLFDIGGIAVVPGDVYGRAGADCVRLVFAVEEATIDLACDRLKSRLDDA